jgi:hypothetical protein
MMASIIDSVFLCVAGNVLPPIDLVKLLENEIIGLVVRSREDE